MGTISLYRRATTGKLLGVVGLGRVGSEVARRAKALGMQVIGYDPFVSEERAKRLGIELAGVDDICRQADFITVHTPLTNKTEGLIGQAQFAMMKVGVRIINCARAGLSTRRVVRRALSPAR